MGRVTTIAVLVMALAVLSSADARRDLLQAGILYPTIKIDYLSCIVWCHGTHSWCGLPISTS